MVNLSVRILSEESPCSEKKDLISKEALGIECERVNLKFLWNQ